MSAADKTTKNDDNIAIAEKLAEQALNKRDPQSDEFKAGVRAALRYRIAAKRIPRPHKMGTVSADAFSAGIREGFRIFRCYKRRQNANRKRQHYSAELQTQVEEALAIVNGRGYTVHFYLPATGVDHDDKELVDAISFLHSIGIIITDKSGNLVGKVATAGFPADQKVTLMRSGQ